ncbi:MAG: aminoacyl-histidine dipeptidase [Ferrimonas sp.]
MSLSTLAPSGLWQWFETICRIPHPSKHELALRDHIAQWAQQQGLETHIDAVGNLIIRKAASAGMENRQGVVLQAHLDMVPQKNSDTEHNFETDPIQPYIDGEWVTATGTTLGADNGIGMASALAILADNSISHGPLEVLLTIDEETGMTGAFGLEPGVLQGNMLINTDSEQEGEIYMGCAGGVDASVTLPMSQQPIPADHITTTIAITGLKGGHSGCDINLGRGNANKVLARFLFGHAEELALQVVSINGGSLRNAIPREAWATVAVPSANLPELTRLCAHYQQMVNQDLGAVENPISVQLVEAEAATLVMQSSVQKTLLAMLHAAPNGVIRMSDHFPGVVETSVNLGVVTTESDHIAVSFLIRSTSDSGRRMTENMVKALAQLAGAQCELSGAYPGWQPNPQSPLMHTVQATYQRLFDTQPSIQVIHAGLECGLFKKPYPMMDMVSIGPTIRFPHSPDEKVEIASVAKYWQLLLAILSDVPTQAA